MTDNQEVNGLESRGKRLASESTPVEQGHDFATSTGTPGHRDIVSRDVGTVRHLN